MEGIYLHKVLQLWLKNTDRKLTAMLNYEAHNRSPFLSESIFIATTTIIMTYLTVKLILQHVTYRFLRYFFIFLQKCCKTLVHCFTNSTLKRPLDIGHIFYRFKLSMVAVATEYDFVWYHHGYQEEDYLMDPRWSLYTMDKHRVHFVYLPEMEKSCNSMSAPFLYMKQYKEALKVASMDLNRFIINVIQS